MNLFTPKGSESATPPSIDDARQKVETMRRGAELRRRASNMLTQGVPQATTAQRNVTGN